jgi:transposase
MDIKTLGIDLAKNVFQLHGVDAQGKMVLKKKIIRSELPNLFVTFLRVLLVWSRVEEQIIGLESFNHLGTK